MASPFQSSVLNHGWTFRDAADKKTEAWHPVSSVPSVVHLDLLDSDLIPDPFIGLNEQEVEWVAHRDWVYRTAFPTPDKSSQAVRLSILFEGLDTFATVTLNETVILKSDNMFIPARVDVTDILVRDVSETNVMEILFESPIRRGREVVKSHPEHRYIAHQTEVGRLGARKAAYHWGWDWGPILITSGPWRPIRLESYVDRIDDVWMQAAVSEDLSSVSGTLHVRTEALGADKVRFELKDQGIAVFQTEVTVYDEAVEAKFMLDKPALWYPHGYGEQRRYELCAQLLKRGTILHEVSKKIGFRRVELVQEKDDHGQSFHFRINNIDIFASGSCWIPGESFLPRLTDKKYEDWLKLMIEGNQNMIRVWGGGIFEPEAFYATCDELGIMVFQDFLFACASYPTYPEYLDSVEQEARANVRLLRHHPSIVIYAGNNEDYQIQQTYNLTYDYDTDKDPNSWLKSSFPARYIYEFLLPKVMDEECPGLPYHPSSPWGDGKHTTDPTVGDIHQWDVWHGTMQPYQNLVNMGGRFVSEFGMEAYPHMHTIDAFIDNPEEKYHQSLTMDFRNKARDHERRLGSYILQNFKVRQDFKAYLYLSQLAQSEAMTFAYKSWRRQWGSKRNRLCGGVLVWQLNDCWPTISWAVVDYCLIKKPAFYAIARASQPLAIGVSRAYHDWVSGHARPPKTSRFDIWVASSRLDPIIATVEVRYISIATGEDIRPSSSFVGIRIQPNGTTDIFAETLDYTQEPYTEPMVIFAKLIVDGGTISRDIDWPQPLKYLNLEERGVKVEYNADQSAVRVTATKPVKGLVFEERPGLWFSENGIDVVPGDERVIAVKGVESQDGLPAWTYLDDDR
ncbi:glycoside hydrolase superfamily [Aspergillus karnatakaensis]|uniref:glycoside hydrolase family 2 protein n=1 Tax=Aspergillus karnatakaensis TaxID=1810916 RepID=UPI003CCDD604